MLFNSVCFRQPQLKYIVVFLLSIFTVGCGSGSEESNANASLLDEIEQTTVKDDHSYKEDIPTDNENTPTTDNENTPTENKTAQERVALAMASGDPSLLPEGDQAILDAILARIKHYETQGQGFLTQIYKDDPISYSPSRHSQFVSINKREGTYPLILGNKGLRLAAASEIDGQRNAAFGTNIILSFNDGNYLSYEKHFKNLLAWLLKRSESNLAEQADVRLMLMDNTTYSRTTAWLNNQYPNWTVTRCDDANNLINCVSNNADLVITGSSTDTDSAVVSTALANAQSQGSAKIYVHLHSWNTTGLTNKVLAGMNFSMQSPGSAGNYFSQDVASWNNYQEMFASTWDLEATRTLVKNFKAGTFPFDLTSCASSCETAYQNEFYAATEALRSTIKQYDNNATDIFNSKDYDIEKLLVLLGDVYRQGIEYPMDVSSTDPLTFLKAWYADHSVYNYRDINPVQADLGNFSRSDFSHIQPSNKAVSLTSKKSFRSAGVYALPGQTFTVTRTDNSAVDTSVFINSIRSSSTKQFESNKYIRPKYLWSASVPIKSGETIRMTSPYGGPIQISFSSNDLAVELTFNNIGLHPHWRSSADDNQFSEALDAGEYDWAEVATEHFEVHSQLSKMRTSLSGDIWTDAKTLAAGTEQYIHNYPHVLAGFQGPGIDVVPEIHDFATNRGWLIEQLDMVKHMNADQPTCGAGCSGNPYDAGWNFNPTGHGDIHELGHGLESGHLRFSGWEGHASTNPYSYYSKSQYSKINNTSSTCQNLPFDDLFNHLKESVKQPDPFAYMQSADLNGWNEGMAIMVQLMMAAQAEGALIDGWHLLARLHISLREFQWADDEEVVWLVKRDSLGFSNFSLNEAKTLSTNDRLAISLSNVTELDYRNLLTMWGLSFSNAASAQIASFGYPVINNNFYQASGNNYCLGLDKPAIAIIDSDNDGVIDSEDAFPNNINESSDADGDGIGDNADSEYTISDAELLYKNVQVSSQYNGRCLAIDNNIALAGQQLMAVDCSAGLGTRWSWENDGRLHSSADLSYCIEANSLNSGASLILSSCSNSANQLWEYNVNSSVISATNKTTQSFDYYTSNGQVNLYSSHGNTNQRWNIAQ
ncbi:hypothetical protein CW745_05240 [Psychromonas sp. psych-6C06]|uniref:ImpA family metalloprotease n=1 Tax=Psychromonas sp. psych-6C06 TaxID=2058089 RepID=UPI000C343F76|nr:ImpA family metalloprotease [Psychromonas sp. psych-6C06]PKF62826.1 hypothetical protein CW745_05240 [Psychromonas sp. psych-6C06]